MFNKIGSFMVASNITKAEWLFTDEFNCDKLLLVNRMQLIMECGCLSLNKFESESMVAQQVNRTQQFGRNCT